ncbi:hypothetical protein HMPREF1171_00350, partial [Aeromonas dhakensis]
MLTPMTRHHAAVRLVSAPVQQSPYRCNFGAVGDIDPTVVRGAH